MRRKRMEELECENMRLWSAIGGLYSLLSMHDLDYGTTIDFKKRDNGVSVMYFHCGTSKCLYTYIRMSKEEYDAFDKSKVNILKNETGCAVFEINGTIYTLDKESGNLHETISVGGEKND